MVKPQGNVSKRCLVEWQKMKTLIYCSRGLIERYYLCCRPRLIYHYLQKPAVDRGIDSRIVSVDSQITSNIYRYDSVESRNPRSTAKYAVTSRSTAQVVPFDLPPCCWHFVIMSLIKFRILRIFSVVIFFQIVWTSKEDDECNSPVAQ